MKILKFGSKGDQVEMLQKQLKQLGFKGQNNKELTVDGDFGASTEFAVIAFQRSKGLIDDGKVGQKTLDALRGKPIDKFLKASDYTNAAKRLNVPELVIRAFAETESKIGGFLADGRAIILFERHHMQRYLAAISKNLAATSAEKYPNVVSTATGGYKGGAAEYMRLSIARSIDDSAALKSCSWGQFQIMGGHYADLGYPSVQDFVEQMQTSESLQLEAFIRFIEWKSGTIDSKKITLLDALRSQNWHAVFTLYNGTAYKRLGYDSKFQRVMQRLTPIYGTAA